MAKKKRKSIPGSVTSGKKKITEKWERYYKKLTNGYDSNVIEKKVYNEIKYRQKLKNMFKRQPKKYEKLMRMYNEYNASVKDVTNLASLKSFVKNMPQMNELELYEAGAFKKDSRYYRIRNKIFKEFENYLKQSASDYYDEEATEYFNQSISNGLKSQGYSEEEINKILDKLQGKLTKKDINNVFNQYHMNESIMGVLNSIKA